MMEIFGGDNAESYYDEGLTASLRGDVAMATQCFESAIRLDQSMASAYHQLGKCYARTGKVERAVKMLEQVVRKRPRFTAARIDLALTLVQASQYDTARKHFEQVLAAEPTNTKALIGLASIDFELGQWDAALDCAQKAQSAGGANFSTLYMIGRTAKLTGDLHLSNGALDKADALIAKYQEMNEEKPEGNYLLGEIAFVRENFLKALESFRKAEDRVRPDCMYVAYGENFGMVDVLAKQGLCYHRLGNPDRAREMGARVQKMHPDHPSCKALLNAE